jgi:hypothetical protein
MKWRSLEESDLNTDTRPLREIFAERKELIKKYILPETRAIHTRAIAELKEKHLAENILSISIKAPAFELPDQNGKSVSSASLLNLGSLVICFIRGRWCPFCVRTTGSHEPDPAPNPASRSLVGGNLAADGAAIILHGRPA